jgi:hypothetical protein
MSSDIDDAPPSSHAIADGWASFAGTVLPSIGGNEHAQAQIAFHFGALYVLQIAQQVIAGRSARRCRSHRACWMQSSSNS